MAPFTTFTAPTNAASSTSGTAPVNAMTPRRRCHCGASAAPGSSYCKKHRKFIHLFTLQYQNLADKHTEWN
jgi:hypothetical protein